jgi:hypothetical protein
MSTPAPPHAAALRSLRRALDRRRIAGVEPRLRLELLALATLVGAFLYWQARVPLDGLVRRGGAPQALGVTAAIVAGLAVAAGLLVAARHRRRLLEERDGPPWLALPVPFEAIADQLAWESRRQALWLAVPALAPVAALIGLVPAPGVIALLLWIVVALALAAHAGAWLGAALAARASAAEPGAHALLRMRGAGAGTAATPKRAPARWSRSPLRAQLRRDVALSLRRTPARARLAAFAACLVAIAAAWAAPWSRDAAVVVAFTLALLAGALLAEWIVALCGLDPFAVLRTLPLGPLALWRARAAWALAGTFAVALLLAPGFARLPDGPLPLLLTWRAAAVFGIALLGVHYGLTLFPNAVAAQRLLTLSLALAMAASLMIPLLGWIVLLTALIHSARRVPRWWALEDLAC